MIVSALPFECPEDELSRSKDGELSGFTEVLPGDTELWDVVGDIIGELVLRGGGEN